LSLSPGLRGGGQRPSRIDFVGLIQEESKGGTWSRVCSPHAFSLPAAERLSIQVARMYAECHGFRAGAE
jgi:hypothetical protein